MADAQLVMLCGHCGNKTVFLSRGQCILDRSIRHEREPVFDDIVTWNLLQCVTCSQVALQSIHETEDFLDTYYDEPVRVRKENILYPSTDTSLTHLPDSVRKKYEEALKVRVISSNSCAVMVGKTLEAVCNHEKSPGKTLSDKINNLVISDRVPNTLAEMAHQIRQIRNLGAHDAEEEVTEEDISIILNFVEAILEYLYVAPAKIEAVRKRLKKTT